MRIKALLSVALIAVAGCDVVPLAPDGASQPAATTAFTWKANTPRAQRAVDISECEVAGRGLPPNATQEQIAAASQVVDPQQVARFVSRCLANKGYTQTQMAVCTDADLRRGELVVGADILPPLNRIRCVDPVRRGIVVV